MAMGCDLGEAPGMYRDVIPDFFCRAMSGAGAVDFRNGIDEVLGTGGGGVSAKDCGADSLFW